MKQLQSVYRLVHGATRIWALLGGLLLLGVVGANVVSVVRIMVFNAPVPGVYEIVQVGVAVAMFMFLPYCQITGSNVTADIFTSGLGRKALVVLAALAAVFAIGLSGLLLWRMSFGLIDLWTYRETTAIYQFPIWIAYLPILVSLALWLLAAAVNLLDADASVPDTPQMPMH